MSDDGEVPPSATVYVRRLDERVKIPVLIESLREIFAEFGNIVDIVAKKSIKRKGQAFVVYDNVDSAQNAIDDLQGFDLFGQQMLLEFAKARSDVTVKREDGEEGLEAHKKERLSEKERKQAIEAQAAAAAEKSAKRAPEDVVAERPAKSAKAAPNNANTAVPDEYLPPNKTLFLRELPENYGKEALALIFGRFPGFREIRLVPGRNTIAFAEYEDESGAVAARERTQGMELGGSAIKVSYQRA